MLLVNAALAALTWASVILAQTAKYCAPSDSSVCYSVNIPDQSASSGSGDVFFQIQGPSSKQWIGLGQGKGMSGANIFVIYADASGNNVTLSPRLGKGHVEPEFNSEAQVFLLDGSGIANGMMTANVRCSSCTSWQGGSMDLTSSSSSWIWAVKDGKPLSSDSQSADIDEHDDKDPFTFDLTKARGGSSINPFATAASTASSSTTSAASSGSQAGSAEGGSEESDDGESKMNRSTIAHGILMALAFVIFYPSGAIVIRLFSFPGLAWIHAGIQGFAFVLTIAGLGIGAWLATTQSYELNHYHPVIGLLVIGALLTQTPTGYIHHSKVKKDGRPSLFTRIHVIVGRLFLTLGIINGGLGLRWAGNTRSGEIAYGVVAGVMWITWMAVAVWGTRFKKNRPAAMEKA